MRKLSLIIVILIFLQNCGFNQDRLINDSNPIHDLTDTLEIDNDEIFILIDKSDYKLSLKAGDSILKEYPVVFGGNPDDDKLMQGDQCTPEGVFAIRDKYPHKNWRKFIWIDYPNDDSWRKFNRAKKEGKIPENAKIGGEIGIHGVPDSYEYAITMKYNWTLGCISMRNNDVDEVYNTVQKGTKIIIQK